MNSWKLPICVACGSQYDASAGFGPSNCKICDDPRQFVPSSGQSWTSLHQIRQGHENKLQQHAYDPRVWSIWTEPKVGIGQRAFLLQTPHGNVLWDLIALLDASTIEQINAKGELKAIVISHPHFYTTYVEWAKAFDCPVYISTDDKEWLCRQPPVRSAVKFIDGPVGACEEIISGVKAVKLGGHFPGSLVLLWEKKLFVADTLFMVPSAYTPHPRPSGQTTFAFQWSIPNMIPLSPRTILEMWRALKPYEFETAYGAFPQMNLQDPEMKKRIWESIKIQVKGMGWNESEVLEGEVI